MYSRPKSVFSICSLTLSLTTTTRDNYNNQHDDKKKTLRCQGYQTGRNNMISFFVDTILPWESSVNRRKRTVATAAESSSRRRDKLRLLATVLSFRFIYLLLMAISCHLIPEHNPGDDVLRFDMRLSISVEGGGGRTNELVDGTNQKDHHNDEGCFCLSGDVCDDNLVSSRPNNIEGDDIIYGCAIYWNDFVNGMDINNTNAASNVTMTRTTRNIRRRIWNFLLSPVTKWDAARFLTLAVRPDVRDPVVPTVSSSSSSSSSLSTQDDPLSLMSSFSTSEQAHAFLPMFPCVIRTLALWYASSMPTFLRPYLVPPTFEGTVTLMGYLFNNIACSIVIILCMYELTPSSLCAAKGNIISTVGSDYEYTQKEKDHNHRSNKSDSSTTISSLPDPQHTAWVTCIVVGLWNPATVFFASNYSESFFCATTLVGHVCMQNMKHQQRLQLQRQLQGHRGMEIFWWILAILSWMIGSYTRSNGTIHCLWLIQDSIAESIFLYDTNRRSQHRTTSIINLVPSMMMIIGRCIIGVALVAFPVRYHDWNGYHRHCSNYIHKDSNGLEPDWCHYLDGEVGSNIKNSTGAMIFGKHGIFRMPFSLYGYVQEKHWNVGLFRYYTFNQIPNFLLATPVMVICFAGVFSWIYWSLVVDYGKGKLPTSMYMLLVGWPLYALPESVSFSSSVNSTMSTKNHAPEDGSLSLEVSSSSYLVHNPRLLGHYAILSVLGLVGLLIAHIQISTRMIFSSSPAIWWFLTYCMLLPPPSSSSSSSDDESDLNKTKETLLRSRIPATNVWCCGYCILFMILGIILHVNFLPWT